jgi:NADH-quinone oxidoreductase subunit H
MPMTYGAMEALVKIAVIVAGLMTAAAYLVLLERRMAAWIQDRRGPNRVGIPLTRIRMFGLGQPLADGMKFLTKEEFTPGHVDRFLYFAAPLAIFTTAVVIFAVIPFGSVLPASFGVEGEPIDLVVAPHVDVGMIYVFAVSSIGVYGVVLGSWASNNKYSFLGGLRSGAQLIAYEIPLGLGLLGIVLTSGSLRLDVIIARQAERGLWNVLTQPLGFVVFVVAAVAEAERLPFDLPEAEQELVGGYHTEYSGIKLMMYLVAEFVHMITAAFLIAILFFGGWHFWGMPVGEQISWPVALLRIAILLGKVFAVILMFMVVRWSWPRFRFDQLMNVAWRLMLPWGMLNVVAAAMLAEYGGRLADATGAPEGALLTALGWCTLGAAWWVGTLWDPTGTDNRPVGRDPEGDC